MGRFLLRLVTRRWGWTLIAALVILGGSLWGATSSTTHYLTGPNTYYFFSATSNGDVYIWTSDSSNNLTFYVARHNEFSPAIDRTQLHLDSSITFVASPDTVSVNEQFGNNIHASQAHVIEELNVYNASRKLVANYKTADYRANPTGYYNNHWWPIGSGIILFGLLMAYCALFVGRKKRAQPAAQTAPGWPYTDIPPYPTTNQQSPRP
jgi:hypothetical protein